MTLCEAVSGSRDLLLVSLSSLFLEAEIFQKISALTDYTEVFRGELSGKNALCRLPVLRKRLVNRAHDRVDEIIPLTLGNESTYLVGDEVFRPAHRFAG
jgi:hypothetical protein